MKARLARSPSVTSRVSSRVLATLRASRSFTAREAEVIRCRYGLVPGPKQTYEQIAGRIGVSRERVRQIEREALDRLKLWVSEDE